MFKIMTKADKLLIIFIIIGSVASIFTIPKLLTNENTEKEVVVNIDGVEIARFELIDSPEPKFKEIPFEINEKEYTALFEMKDGSIMLHRLPEEVVPLGIHEDMGWISESYQMIVALPAKMYVTVEKNIDNTETNDKPDYDVIVQ